jgi:phage-related protein
LINKKIVLTNKKILFFLMNVTSKVKRKQKRKNCNFLNCPSSAAGATDLCKAHGGGKRCTFTNCPKSAAGATDLCKAHDGGKRCIFLNCPKSAQGATDFCFAHGGGKRCIFLNCPSSAAGATDFCKTHGGGKRCTFTNCPKSAERATDFCISHGGGKRCTFLNCPTSARGATDFCISHGGGKRCTFTNCPKGAERATDFCKAHGGGKRCTFTNCPKSAAGATDFCSNHGGGKRCPNCINWIDSQGANKKYNGFCARCYCRLFPNDPRVRRNYKTKEGAVLCHIRQCFPDLIIPNDRRIDGGCSKKKPDFFIELLTHVIIIEVDENGHLSYNQSCENKRIMQLSEDIAHRPMVLIRFNPDKNSDGSSCWGVDGNGLAVVNKKQTIEWQKRLAGLTAAISFWITTIPDKTVELIKLFY